MPDVVYQLTCANHTSEYGIEGYLFFWPWGIPWPDKEKLARYLHIPFDELRGDLLDYIHISDKTSQESIPCLTPDKLL